MNVDVSPGGDTLVFDLLGDLYQLPIEGGEAIQLTSGKSWDQAPRFSPDGTDVYFVSDRRGYKNLWRLTLADGTYRQITHFSTDVMGSPNWSQSDDRLLVGIAIGDAAIGHEVVLHSIDADSGEAIAIDPPVGQWLDVKAHRRLRNPASRFSAVGSADGKIYFSEAAPVENHGRLGVRLHVLDEESQVTSSITSEAADYSDYKPQLSRDGKRLAYFRRYTDSRTELRIVDRETGLDSIVTGLIGADDAAHTQNDDSRPNYSFTPNGDAIVFWHNGKIRRAQLSDGFVDVIPFNAAITRQASARIEPSSQRVDDVIEASTIRWPSLSQNGQTLVFSVFGYVWVMNVETGSIRRLTASDDMEYMPSISPDGRFVAHINYARIDDAYGPGRLMISEISNGDSRELLAASQSESYLAPRWSSDGSRIALIRETVKGRRTEAAFGWTSAAVGLFNEVAVGGSFAGSRHPASYDVDARYVGFDAAGKKLLFSYPDSISRIVLAAADLNHHVVNRLGAGAPDIASVKPSPDLRNLVITRRDGSVWVTAFDPEVQSAKATITTAGANIVSETGGFYLDWSGAEQLTFGLGRDIYRYSIDRRKLEVRRVTVRSRSPEASTPIAFTGADLVTLSDESGAATVIKSGTLVVSGTRIAAVGPADSVQIPVGALVIDVAGKTILPGFIDSHYHRIGGGPFSALALPGPRVDEKSASIFGVTSAWEPGGPAGDGVPALVDLRNAGRIMGPRWSHSAAGAVGVGSIARPYELLTDYRAALVAVERHRRLGVRVLKEYNAPTRKQRQWLSTAAREKGLGIVSHLQSFDGMMTRIVDGYSGGEHSAVPLPFYKDVLELLRQTSYIWTPNIVTTYGTTGDSKDNLRYYCAALDRMRVTQASAYRKAQDNSVCDWSDTVPTVPYDSNRISLVATQVAMAANHGVRIGVSAHSVPASKLHREMWYLWKGGMSTADVLRATTLQNAEKMGLRSEIGSLDVGKIADLLVLDANPLDDILSTLSLRYTVHGGVVYWSETGDPLDEVASGLRKNGSVTH